MKNVMTTMTTYKVKFYGALDRHQQITKQTLIIIAPTALEAIDKLKTDYGYAVVNGVKIRKVEDQ